ncbi:MAG: ABC transporter substrate-binding protein [Alphaproteobacteria bacterium]
MAMLSVSRRAALGALALAGLGPRVSLSADGRVLRVRTDLDPQSLDPGWMIGGLAETTLQHACLGTLAVYTPGETWGWRASDFVEHLEQVDDLRIDFRLRPGIQWSNGNGELSAEDVQYSIERLANPANQAPWAGKWAVLDHVEVHDALAGSIVLKEPFAPIWLTTIPHATASFVCKRAIEERGTAATLEDGTVVKTFGAEFPAICGPYMVKDWLPKQRVELTRNPDWNGPEPAFAEIHIVTIEDEKAAEIAYDAGELDLTAISLDSLKAYQQVMPADTTLTMRPGTFWTWLGMNTQHANLADLRVRQAIQRAVDVDAILAAAYADASPRSFGVVPPGVLGHRDASGIGGRDVEGAKALIAEVGAEGMTLSLTTLNKSDRLSAAQIIQANLAEIGLIVDVRPYDEATFWNLGLESEGADWKDLQLILQRYGDAPDPSQMMQWYVSSQVGVWNWERWTSEEFDRLASDGIKERDPAKRAAIYVRMQEIMEETGAYVWITHEPIPHLHRDDVVPAIFPDGLMFLPGFAAA